MVNKTYTNLQKMDVEDAKEYIELFAEEFGPLHLYLAKHAAFPLALTPDLLYRLWVNFQRDNLGGKYPIPWIAVADLLLSPLCKEVRYELYEMDITIRSLLLNMLKDDKTLGMKRIQELSNFLLDYVYLQLNSNLNVRTSKLASAQRWTALAYTKPSKVAHELSETISALSHNKAEQIRIASLTEALNVLDKPGDFEPFMVLIHDLENLSGSDIPPHTTIDSEIRTETHHTTTNLNKKSAEVKRGSQKTAEIQSNIEALLDSSARDDNRAIEIIYEIKPSKKKPVPNYRLKAERMRRGWTHMDVADMLAVPDSRTISRWERGISFPRPHYRQGLSRIFGISLDELGLIREKVENIDQSTLQPNTQDMYMIASHEEIYPNHLLRIAREQLGWTQAEVAEKLGSSVVSIARWEQGKGFPSTYYQSALCTVFNMSLDELGLLQKESVNPKFLTSLTPILERGKIHQGNLIHFDKKDATDPAEIFDQQVSLIEQTERIVQIVTSFPPRQQHALLYSMKENIQDLPPIVVKIFRDYGLDLERIEPIQDKVEIQRMRASLAVARKKLLHAYHADMG